MKKIIIPMLMILSIASACDKKLDISPENTLTDRDVFKTEAGAEQALAEAYYNLYKASTGNIAYAFGDFTTPLLITNDYYNTYKVGEATPVDDGVVSAWTSHFKAINTANNVIARINEFATFDPNIQKQFIAESKFIRALAYLNLLRMFGDGALTGETDGYGLPIQLTPFEGYNTGDVVARSSNGDVYAQIEKDLKESITDLPAKFNTDLKTRSRATKGSAWALLSRSYLYSRQYEKAADAAEEALADPENIYDLITNLRSIFPDNTSGAAQALTQEHFLAFPVSSITSSSTSENNNLGNGYFFKRSFYISQQFVQEHEPGDLRVSQLMFKGDQIYNTNALNEFTTFKFNNQNGRDNVPVIRYAEVVLNRAEALARTTGVTSEAVNLLNSIRNRAVPGATPYTVASFANATALINAILEQRKFELAFEGFYRYDLIRTGQQLTNPDLPEKKKVLPIPQIEVDISNGIIRQNTGYTS